MSSMGYHFLGRRTDKPVGDVLSILPAWLGFDAVDMIHRQREILFMVVWMRHIRHLKKILNRRQVYDKNYSIPGSQDIPGLSPCKSRDPGIAKSPGIISPRKGWMSQEAQGAPLSHSPRTKTPWIGSTSLLGCPN